MNKELVDARQHAADTEVHLAAKEQEMEGVQQVLDTTKVIFFPVSKHSIMYK